MEYLIQDTTLTGIADAIRAKTGGSAPIQTTDMAAQIEAIPTGGGADPWDEEPPEDGKTRLYIKTMDDNMEIPVSVWIVSGTVTIDWGDGSAPGSLTEATYGGELHTYASAGKYIITISVSDGGGYTLGVEDHGQPLVGAATSDRANRALKRLYVGDGCQGNYNYALWNSYCLEKLVLHPAQGTSIPSETCAYCYGLLEADIGDSVTSIGSMAFFWCSSLSALHMRTATPPTLGDEDALDGIPEDCIIYVPAGSLAAYQGATNWSIYASQMQEETT